MVQESARDQETAQVRYQTTYSSRRISVNTLLSENCSDCSNTVMASGPKMGLKVIHQTDHIMRAVDHPLYRTLRVSKQVDQDLNVVDNV